MKESHWNRQGTLGKKPTRFRYLGTIENLGNECHHRGGIDCESDHSHMLASGSHEDDAVRLWDVTNGQEITAPMTHKSGVNAVVFSPDGATLVSGGLDSEIKLWDVGTITTDCGAVVFRGPLMQLT